MDISDIYKWLCSPLKSSCNEWSIVAEVILLFSKLVMKAGWVTFDPLALRSDLADSSSLRRLIICVSSKEDSTSENLLRVIS